MQPGDRYYSEAEALKLHAVSRGTLREAIRFLQIQGVVDIKPGPGGGTFVGKPNWEQLASTLALVLQFSGASIESLIQARTAIEPGIARLAAKCASEEDLAVMREALDEMDKRLDNYPAYYRAYGRFWNRVAIATQNPLLEMLSPALRKLTRSGGIVPDEVGRASALERARGVFAAIADHDEDAAYQAMAELEQNYIKSMRTNYPRQISKVVAFSETDPDLDL
jgi:DNA-binding FadR family transcriptional regulator